MFWDNDPIMCRVAQEHESTNDQCFHVPALQDKTVTTATQCDMSSGKHDTHTLHVLRVSMHVRVCVFSSVCA